jgi:hypothetical protein
MKFLLSISLSMLCISVVNTTFFTLHDLEGYLKKFLKWGLLPTPNPSQEGNSCRTQDTLSGVLQTPDALSEGDNVSDG